MLMQIDRGGETNVFCESVRMYSKEEMLGMLRDAGFTVKDVVGSIEGEPYSESSDRMILYGYKPISGGSET